ncbi:unnamed protein product [Musa hybrid cultivar]
MLGLKWEDGESNCDAISSLISAASAAAALVVAVAPRFFVVELALAASVALQGLWSFQTGLSLYVEAFIPEGCHRLLGLRNLSSTRCDIESSRLRAAALLDLFFTLHATLIAIVTSIVYTTMTRAYGGNGLVRRHNGGSYDALLTSLSDRSLRSLRYGSHSHEGTLQQLNAGPR